ncbi:MAG: nuclear transport factor 2 family protein [Bacteroidota bacterium]
MIEKITVLLGFSGSYSSFPSRVILLLVLLGWGSSLNAQEMQTEEEAVKAVIERLFEGMYEGDSAKVSSTMGADVKMETTANKDGEPVLFPGSLERFLTAVGTPHEQVWDERISNLDIKIDDNLAIAWMDYSFYVGDTFSHCGVNAMSLFRTPEGWKIIYLIDTRRKEGCE